MSIQTWRLIHICINGFLIFELISHKKSIVDERSIRFMVEILIFIVWLWMHGIENPFQWNPVTVTLRTWGGQWVRYGAAWITGIKKNVIILLFIYYLFVRLPAVGNRSRCWIDKEVTLFRPEVQGENYHRSYAKVPADTLNIV